MLRKQLSEWDQKSKDDIARIYDQHSYSLQWLDELIELLSIPSCTTAASWLLKHHFDKGNPPTEEQAVRLYKMLDCFEDWQSQLHFLQMMDSLPVRFAEKKSLELFLRNTLMDTNKFIRAWSYNGWFLFAREYPDYRAEVISFFEMAMVDEAASVKARVRKLLKSNFDN